MKILTLVSLYGINVFPLRNEIWKVTRRTADSRVYSNLKNATVKLSILRIRGAYSFFLFSKIAWRNMNLNPSHSSGLYKQIVLEKAFKI